jgi:hypothetical protein
MQTYYLRLTKRLFNSGIRSTDRHNRRAWVKSVRMLGDKWLLAKQVGKL